MSTADAPLSITEFRALALELSQGGGSEPPPAPFAAMVKEDFNSYTVGNNYSQGSWKANRCIIDNTRAFTGDRCMKLIIDAGQPPVACGGEGYFGGRQSLPALVPLGSRVWFRLRLYFPNSFSWGYVYQNNNASDEADAATCGLEQSSDGNDILKFMRLSPDIGTGRLYLQPPVHRRNVDQPIVNRSMTLIAEGSASRHDIENGRGRLLPNVWNAPQLEVLVSDDETGYMRYWLGDEFVDEITGISTVAPGVNGINEWAIGTHFNGVQFTDGEPGRSELWIDDVIIASDAPGYDLPSGVDSAGRPFISPDTTSGDLA